MSNKVSREKVDNDLYTFLRTIYHYERSISSQFDLDYQEIYLLQSLRRTSPQRLTEIANTLEIPMFTASRLVGRLMEKNFLTKVKGSQDRRSISVSLLPKGEEIVQAIEAESFKRIQENTTDMSDEELNSLLTMAEKLYEILGIPQHRIS